MRIIINGQQAFGKACLEAILDKGADEVVCVYTAPDQQGVHSHLLDWEETEEQNGLEDWLRKTPYL